MGNNEKITLKDAEIKTNEAFDIAFKRGKTTFCKWLNILKAKRACDLTFLVANVLSSNPINKDNK